MEPGNELGMDDIEPILCSDRLILCFFLSLCLFSGQISENHRFQLCSEEPGEGGGNGHTGSGRMPCSQEAVEMVDAISGVT